MSISGHGGNWFNLDFTARSLRVLQFPGNVVKSALASYFEIWERIERGAWEPQTFKVFDYYIDSETTFVDFGTWIGCATASIRYQS